MAQKTRQNKLFAAEDYTVIYESYVNANFQAFDYDTIRTAMVAYVRNTYPENYNDWVESAEFVSLLDVVAQFGHNLAYRVDLNARNNFLTTARKQDSVFKLAEFLGYQPRRNVPAYGEMKVIGIKTNESVIGSAGTSLGGVEIKYEASNNVSNIDDFITVLNATLENSNQYGSPKKSSIVNGIQSEFYDINNTPNQIKFDVQGIVSGKTATYNIISSEFDSVNKAFMEKAPSPIGSVGVYFKNDGKGISSVNTGFFMGVKQGALSFQDFVIDTPIDSAVLDVTAENINNTDVWVQNVNATGNVVKNWSKVTDVNSNVIYNNLASGIRDVYSVKTRTNNSISIMFPSKEFGNVPTGTIRVWYRTSANTTYVVRPDDLTNKKVNIGYTGLDGNTYTAILSLQLKQAIVNATSSETMDSVRENAPKNYASQDRMITAQDYNTLLSSQQGGILKLKSVNRTFSGHSRYSKFTDPTGTYSDLFLSGKDATIYASEKVMSTASNATDSSTQTFEKHVKHILDNDEFINLYYTKYKTAFEALRGEESYTPDSFVWQSPSESTSGILTGYITDTSTQIARVGSTASTYMKYITPGALIKFTSNSKTKWAKVVDIFANGLGMETTVGAPTGKRTDGTGAIILDTDIPNGSTVNVVYPGLSRRFIKREKDVIKYYLESQRDFSIKYNYKNKSWDIIGATGTAVVPTVAYPTTFSLADDSWILNFKFTGSSFDIYIRTLRFNFTSATVRLGNIQNEYEISSYTKKATRDKITAIGVDGNDIVDIGDFYVYGYDTATDNNYRLSLIDSNADSRPDNPDIFFETVGLNSVKINTVDYDGRSSLNFDWQHIASDNQVVDPSFTNIIDVYALTTSYDTSYKNWLKGTLAIMPKPPTSYELGTQFSATGEKKAMSDTIVFKPVKYKPIFGAKASAELKAKFRIIKVVGCNVTDSDMKTRTVKAIDEFFSSSVWDFGETFYFTELAAYVHKQLVGVLSSFVIVPQGTGTTFGDLFEYTPELDELIIADVTVNDIDIIQNITDENIRAGT
jgi:hypothetical protein